jgi:molybdopterin molybdotransferase
MRRDLSVAEALEAVLGETPGPVAETLAAAGALGRVLTEPVSSQRVIPPADNSAMDGFALRAADAAGASAAAPVALRVAYEIAAGGALPRALQAGEAARIFTGAPLPPGADCVVRQEDADGSGDAVRIRVAPRPGDHVRAAGEDVQAGETVLLPGEKLGPAQLGMLAALGRTVVSVAARPRVAILSGGDELVEPDGDVSGGRIVASNSWTLAAQCREAGAEPRDLGIARDEPAEIERRLRAGLRADVLLSSAGVSVGDRDHVRDVLAKLGCRIAFWGVRMKPGYPVVFGRFDDGPLVFGLPGNPVSAMVTFEQFVRPALLRMQGVSRLFRPRLRARAAHALRKPAGRLHFVRVTLERRDGALLARETGSQSSGVLRSMALAHGLLVFPAEAVAIAAGDEVAVQLLDESFLHEADAGL